MKVVAIRSAPRQCPECGSEKLGGLINIIENGGSTVLCHDCGVWMQVSDGEEVELTATVYICPHCKTAGAIEEMEGEEWCNGCGLDPNIQEYPAPTLAHLWKKDSGIQGTMQRNRNLLGPDRNLGKFLRTCCGPHCMFEKACSQEVGNFVKCYKEEYPDKSMGEDMSRKSRKARKRRRRQEREVVSKASEKALVMCASSSWFEKVLYANSPCPEQTDDTGSGSGT